MLKEVYEKGKVRIELEDRFPGNKESLLIVRKYENGVNTPSNDWVTDDAGLARQWISKAFDDIEKEERRKMIDEQIDKLKKARLMISEIADELGLDDHCPLRAELETSMDGLKHIARAIRK